jgi:ubiquitin-protein ligase
MQELRLISEKGKHPFIHVLPCEETISFWRLLIEGPEGTSYAGGVFVAYIHFPDAYPAEPPEVRFVTPIYHCNINNSGRVCHSIFDRDYNSATKVSFILQCVYGLLMYPAPDDPLDSMLAAEFISNPGQYNAKAAVFTQQHAKGKTIAEWKRELAVDETPEEDKADVEHEAPREPMQIDDAPPPSSSSSSSAAVLPSRRSDEQK